MFAGIILAMMMMIKVPEKADIFVVDDMAAIREMPPSKPTEKNDAISDEEFELLCKCVEAEAGDQGYLGKVYVTDCILNRCDAWDKTITEIIYQKHQFEVVSNNRINKVEVTEETRQAVRDELRSRTRYDILHFRMDYYHSFGTPVFSYKDHYFSK